MIALLLVQCAAGIAACVYSFRLGKRAGRIAAHEEMSADAEAHVPPGYRHG